MTSFRFIFFTCGSLDSLGNGDMVGGNCSVVAGEKDIAYGLPVEVG